MGRKIKAKDLAKLWSQLDFFENLKVSFEHTRGGVTRTLSEVEPDRNERGRPTVKRIRAVENGKVKYYDGNYEFEVTALLANGARCPVPEISNGP